MHRECPSCGVKFEREPGFFLGSIYVNYGLTSLIVVITYPVLLFGGFVPETPLLMMSLAFVVAFPILIFPWARSLWLGFDQWRDPRDGEVIAGGLNDRDPTKTLAALSKAQRNRQKNRCR
jgi:hypothetical protein